MPKQADKPKTEAQLEKEIQRLEGLLEEERNRFREAQETLEAIRTGAVDGIVRSTPEGEQVFILKGSDQPYRNLIEEMKEGALLISESGIILYSNIGFAGLVDAPLDKVIGTHLSDWVSARNIEVLNKIIAGNNTDGKRVFDISFQNTKHQLIPTQVSLSKIALDSINASALIITDLSKHMEEEIKRYTANLEHEITERKKAEEALKESEHKFKTLAENAPDAIMRFDKDLRVLYLNPQDLAATGKRLEEFIGKTNEEMGMPTELCKLWNEMFYKAKTSGQVQRVEFDFNTTVGVRTFSLRIVPEFSEDGSLISFIGVSRDITESKKAEESLKEAKAKIQDYAANLEKLVEERTKQLKDSERMAAIGQVAGMVGHDIRNPLQAIMSDVYLLRCELADMPACQTKEGVAESLEGIENNVNYMNKIVADLQDYSRAIMPAAQEVDLGRLIEGVLSVNGYPANIRVACNIQDSARVFISDEYLLKRIISNLTSNAVQAMPQGGKIVFEAFKDKDNIVLTVEDTGIGIPKEIREKLFTPMFTTKSKGQGFGLAVCKRLTEALGGTIAFESEVGKGTKFILCLPPQRNKR